jgi:hypothetical protein
MIIMRYMNDYDFARAYRTHADQPNRLRVLRTVDNLRDWADRNSDGWAYWPKPCRAAARAIELVVGDGTYAADQRPDATDAEVAAALRPIKAFLTRQGVDHATILA